MNTKLTTGKKYRISDSTGNSLVGIAISESEVALTGFLAGYMGINRILNAKHIDRCDASIVEERMFQPASATETIISAMLTLAVEIESEDGVANGAIAEAAERLAELDNEIKELKARCNLYSKAECTSSTEKTEV